MTVSGKNVRGWQVEMRPWAQIIRGRCKTENIQIHSTALTHRGAFPQTDTDLVAAGIRISTSNITREKFKSETLDRGAASEEIKRLNPDTASCTDVSILGNLQTHVLFIPQQLHILFTFPIKTI